MVEVVKDKSTKEPIATRNAKGAELKTMNKIGRFLRNNGLFTFIKANMIFVVPPLCITKTQIDEGIEIIDRALTILDEAIQT